MPAYYGLVVTGKKPCFAQSSKLNNNCKLSCYKYNSLYKSSKVHSSTRYLFILYIYRFSSIIKQVSYLQVSLYEVEKQKADTISPQQGYSTGPLSPSPIIIIGRMLSFYNSFMDSFAVVS